MDNSDEKRGIEWVRDYPEVAYPLLTCKTRTEALAYIAKHYAYATPPEGATEKFFEGAHEEALRV